MDEHEQGIDQEATRDVAAAAVVHAAKREIDGAIAKLAASPLDVQAADQMREVLASPKLRSARTALGRLQPGRRPHLSVVPTGGSSDAATGSEAAVNAAVETERCPAATDSTHELTNPGSGLAGGLA